MGGCGGGSSPSVVEPAVSQVNQATITSAPSPEIEQTTFSFVDSTAESGLSRSWGVITDQLTDPEYMASGLTAVDFDLDGDIDVYVTGGNLGANKFFENRGNAVFVETGSSIGLDITHKGSGPVFADIDQDRDLDLFVGSVEGDTYYLLENRNGLFVDITASSGLLLTAPNTFSAAFADYDFDGDLDLALSHWRNPEATDTQTLWRNRGDGTFDSSSVTSKIAKTLIDSSDPEELQIRAPDTRRDNSFTPSFSDIDSDGDLDLLMVSDFRTSQVFKNSGDGTFINTTDREVIKDQAGMGSALADYDNDGDIDWFVTSIYKEDENSDEIIGYGNRLYANDGNGNFADVSDEAGIGDGGWGWAACFADFDNDGHEDIFHVNGWSESSEKTVNDYRSDAARLFHNQGDGTFREISQSVGIIERGQGRGLVCFDADRDGDIDILVANNESEQLKFYKNNLDNGNRYITIELEDFGIGAKVWVRSNSISRVKEIYAGSNFVSQNPFEAHFGLGELEVVDVTVEWPDGTVTEVKEARTNQLLKVDKTGAPTKYVLNVLNGAGGGTYEEAEVVTVVAAEPPEGYYFSHWMVEGDLVLEDRRNPTITISMNRGSVSLIANFLPGVAPDSNVSLARQWNEVLLQAIRNDFARPTVHARNLFHLSSAAYDSWAMFAEIENGNEVPWLAGTSRLGLDCLINGFDFSGNVDAGRREAISFAYYRLLLHRFRNSPNVNLTVRDAEALMNFFEYDKTKDQTEFETGSEAFVLGNIVADCYIRLGLADGSNEENDYSNINYSAVNPALDPTKPGNPNIVDPNRWQPLDLEEFIDQSGNLITDAPTFLGAEWGEVYPFSLSSNDMSEYKRDEEDYSYKVYLDPGSPPKLGEDSGGLFQWSHSLVAVWSSHLDPSGRIGSGSGSELIDISPAGIGNLGPLPDGFDSHSDFYNLFDGGTFSPGYSLNPVTNAPYISHRVPLGDYTRVLAEFWADGPESETPPGHWFVILNQVNQNPLLERRIQGVGEEKDMLEWDVKSYFSLGGAMHDSAIAAWSIKGWYDYARPISAIRAMADKGQSSDSTADSYHPDGILLIPGYIELVNDSDSLVGNENQNIGKIKLLAWKGPNEIDDSGSAGVDWILAEDWWPYQRPSFVTPPFAGFISGHSTYSRAAAEVLSRLTGDPFFPGGLIEFSLKANQFLEFEKGPSVDVNLQWATYKDAADQCSLSRIWGGIHPTVDDIPGRVIGSKIGADSFLNALQYFDGTVSR